jgi:hypothetical protein
MTDYALAEAVAGVIALLAGPVIVAGLTLLVYLTRVR